MPELLYLDTARVGQISPSANRALIDYFRLHAEHRLPLYFEEFFRESTNLPDSIASQYRGLKCWRGISHLRDDMRRLVGADSRCDVWFSARSSKLMEFAAKLMFRRCRKVLISDLTWPGYESVLRAEIPNHACQLATVELSERIFNGTDPKTIVDFVTSFYLQNKCDGLCLPLVSNLGVHLPVKNIVREIRERSNVRFVCVDVAQAINHVPIDTNENYFDFAIGGSHKWLRSFVPLGVGISGNPGTCDFIRESALRWIGKKMIDDPLFLFACESQTNSNIEFGETLNASPLLACAGAVMDAEPKGIQTDERLDLNCVREQIADIFMQQGLRVRNTSPGFRSNILTLQVHNSSSTKATNQVHEKLRKLGIATSLVSNLLRISIPPYGLSPSQLSHLTTINNK